MNVAPGSLSAGSMSASTIAAAAPGQPSPVHPTASSSSPPNHLLPMQSSQQLPQQQHQQQQIPQQQQQQQRQQQQQQQQHHSGAPSPPTLNSDAPAFQTSAAPAFPSSYAWTQMGENRSSETSSQSPPTAGPDADPMVAAGSQARAGLPTVYIRRLPRNTGSDSLRSMLLFAQDLVEVEFVATELFEDKAFSSAIARFKTVAGALDTKEKLHGRPNAANDATMIVEVFQTGAPASLRSRSYTIDGAVNRQSSSSTSPAASTNGNSSLQSSWFSGGFQGMDKVSPPVASAGLGNGDFTVPDNKTHFQSVFSPQSPIGATFNERARASGKSLINDNDDAGDDEELLKDTVAFAKHGQAGNLHRRATNPQMPVSRFANLSLTTNGAMSPPLGGFASPRGMTGIHSPHSAMPAMSPNNITSALPGMGPNGTPTGFQMGSQHFRHNYPPVNPADQNPPCNTLYVGNLPIDTSEDELKAMFSKQRGYKRLCFRTKQNGPMCFVEFEDVSHATRALNELYGQPLHNSVKGGIRLSFSKNPLGVRAGQNNGSGGHSSLTPTVAPGMSNGMQPPGSFSTATGPPPGLTPPSLQSPMSALGGGSGFGMASPNIATNLRSPLQGMNQVTSPGLFGYARSGFS